MLAHCVWILYIQGKRDGSRFPSLEGAVLARIGMPLIRRHLSMKVDQHV